MSWGMKIFLIVICLPMLAVSWMGRKRIPPDGLRLPPEITHAAYMGYGLTQDDLDALTANFAGLEPTLRVMRERADGHLICYIPGQKRPKVYAIYLYEGLIFEGYDSEAWIVRGQAGRALMHKMNSATRILLDHYEQEANEQAERRRHGGRV
jgi:hypothetical protein